MTKTILKYKWFIVFAATVALLAVVYVWAMGNVAQQEDEVPDARAFKKPTVVIHVEDGLITRIDTNQSIPIILTTSSVRIQGKIVPVIIRLDEESYISSIYSERSVKVNVLFFEKDVKTHTINYDFGELIETK